MPDDDLHARLTAALQARLEVARAATPGPWWWDESDQCMRLHGVHAVIPAQDPFPEQVVNHQILKAPKTGTPYAEYWPSPNDAAHIVANDPATEIRRVEALLRVVERHAQTAAPLRIIDIEGTKALAEQVLASLDDSDGHTIDVHAAAIVAARSLALLAELEWLRGSRAQVIRELSAGEGIEVGDG